MADNGQPQDEREGGGPEPAGVPQPLPDIRPWRDMFFRPRATVRWLLERETARSALLQWLSFTSLCMVVVFLAVMLYPGVFEHKVTKMELVVATPFVFLLSWGYFVVSSYLFWLVGRLLGGRCEVWEMRVVNAFTTVIPGVVFGGLRFGLFVLFGKVGLAGTLADNAMMLWSGYITLSGIAAVAGISVWRALAVYFVSLGVWMVAVMAAAAVVRAVFGQLPGM